MIITYYHIANFEVKTFGPNSIAFMKMMQGLHVVKNSQHRRGDTPTLKKF